MKTLQLLLSVFIISIMLLLFSNCNKADKTSIRVNNVDPIVNLSKVQIGPAYFGLVKNKELSNYKGITEGTHKVTYTWGNTNMEGEISIDSKGKYTLFMTSLTIQLQKD